MTITIRDAATGSSARILPSFGFNCFSFRPVFGGEPLEVLWAAEDVESGDARPSGSGVPILFPFPGRIQGTVMSWRGKDYRLTEGDGRGNAIHGFVHCRAWRTIEQAEDRVVGEFQASIDDPSLLACWPSDFRIRCEYSVAGNALRSVFTIENPGQDDLPFGFGTHPYFRVPLGGASADDCVVTVPVNSRWELAEMIASGKTLSLTDETDLSQGVRFGDTQLDAGFSELDFENGVCTGRIADPAGRTLSITFDEAFRECVVYNPPHREAICIEPYTCICDPFRLEATGIDAGLRVVARGDRFQTTVVMEVS